MNLGSAFREMIEGTSNEFFQPKVLKIGKREVVYKPDYQGLAEKPGPVGNAAYEGVLPDPKIGYPGIGAGRYTVTLSGGQRLNVDIQKGDGKGHPVINFNLDGAYSAHGLNSEGKKKAIPVAREMVAAVTDILQWHSKKYRPSAYEYEGTTTSRGKLYQTMADQAGSDYQLTTPRKLKWAGGEEFNKEGQLTFAPSKIKDVVQGLVATSPFAAYGLAQALPEEDSLESSAEVPETQKMFKDMLK